jgi:superfamily I DNA/RNA helicase
VKRLAAFRELVDKLVTFAKHTADATSAATFMLEQTGLVQMHMQEGTEESTGRAENLKELLTATQEFDKQREERLAAAGRPLPWRKRARRKSPCALMTAADESTGSCSLKGSAGRFR